MTNDLTALWNADLTYDRLVAMAKHVQQVNPRNKDAALTGPLQRLDYLTEIISNAETLVGGEVSAAREAGASWSAIGAQLGISKQAAQKRFGTHD